MKTTALLLVPLLVLAALAGCTTPTPERPQINVEGFRSANISLDSSNGPIQFAAIRRLSEVELAGSDRLRFVPLTPDDIRRVTPGLSHPLRSIGEVAWRKDVGFVDRWTGEPGVMIGAGPVEFDGPSAVVMVYVVSESSTDYAVRLSKIFDRWQVTNVKTIPTRRAPKAPRVQTFPGTLDRLGRP